MRRDATNKCGCFGILADNNIMTPRLENCVDAFAERTCVTCGKYSQFIVPKRETTTTVSKFGLMNDVARRQSRVGDREGEIHETYYV